MTHVASTSATAPTELRCEQRDGALWLTLARPEAFNALTPAMVAQLDHALDAAETDASIRVVVITGAGSAFCAGADLKAVLAAGSTADADASFRAFLRNVGRVFRRLETLPVPTVAAVNGVALAGGLELLLCCDFAIAAASAKLGDAHANFGQLPGGGGSVRLPRRVGQPWARWLMFTGSSLPAAEAQAIGLVQQVVVDAALVDSAEALVRRCADKSPLVLARMKQLLRGAAESTAEVALEAELSMSHWHAGAHDRNEGLAAFAEKRRPVYLGR